MGNISKNFDRAEFECKCSCGFNTVDVWIVQALQLVRDKFGRTIITSGCRCRKHNATIDGAHPESKHIYGCAADFICMDGDPVDWMTTIKASFPDRGYDFKLYDNRVHIEVDVD